MHADTHADMHAAHALTRLWLLSAAMNVSSSSSASAVSHLLSWSRAHTCIKV
jgi:hypothetical protein